jgi:cytochrome c
MRAARETPGERPRCARLVLLAAALSGWLAGAPARADEALARQRNCFACHAVEGKLVGPAYRDVAARYAGDTGAEARLALKIRSGGAGVWGQLAMAPNPAVTEAEARQLARWVLGLR